MKRPMDHDRLALFRERYSELGWLIPSGEARDYVRDLLADRDYHVDELARLRARCPVTAADIEDRGVTSAHANDWLFDHGWKVSTKTTAWTRWEHPRGSLTTTWTEHMPDQLSVAIHIAASCAGLSEWDVLDQMASVRVTPLPCLSCRRSSLPTLDDDGVFWPEAMAR